MPHSCGKALCRRLEAFLLPGPSLGAQQECPSKHTAPAQQRVNGFFLYESQREGENKDGD